MKFKIGDKVRQTHACSSTKAGQIYTVFANWYDGTLSINEKGTLDGVELGSSEWSACTEQDRWELVEEKKEHKFKVGDRVISKQTGEMDIIKSFPGMKEYDERNFGDADKGFVLKNNSWEYQKNWNLVRKPQREEVKEEERFDNHEEHMEIHEYYIQDYQPKKTLMKKVSTLARKLFDADTRVLVEAGYLFDDLTLSSEGKNVLLDMLLLQYKKQMATEARKAIRAAKKCEEDEDEE